MNISQIKVEPKIIETVKDAFSEFSNVDPDEINLQDHLVEDLFIKLETDMPKIIRLIEQELKFEIDPETIADFISELKDEERPANVLELAKFIKEELDLS